MGEETMRATFKNAAEQAAFAYQESAWGMLLRLVERDVAVAKAEQGTARTRAEEFMRGFEINMRKHQSLYGFRDADLRNQIREAVEKMVVPAYAEFLHANAAAIPRRSFLPPDSIRALIRQAFDAAEEGEEEEGKKPSSVPKAEGEKVPQRRGRIRREQEQPPELGGSGSFGY